jgi:hypothetical protein
MLVAMLVVAGCLPQPTPDLPASFLSSFGDGATFTVQTPPAGATGQEVAAALRRQGLHPMVTGRAVPVFGTVDCHGNMACTPGPAGVDGGRETVWLLVYPDCTDGKDVGWVEVDAVKGLEAGSPMSFACPQGF